MPTHHYSATIKWTGDLGSGTSGYTKYDRTHVISVDGKPAIPASSDPAFRGSRERYNPEELLVASLSSCHMLWYLHLCSDAGIVVWSYQDPASGTMEETKDGGGRFTEVTLHPIVNVGKGADLSLAMKLHEKAHDLCFIANSVDFPVRCEAKIQEQTPAKENS